MEMGRTWVEKDFLLFSSRKGSLRAGEDTREDGLPWTQQGRMCGTSQAQLGSTEQAKLKININY